MAGKVWRGGLMGHASNTRNILICLGALDDVPGRMNAPSAGFLYPELAALCCGFNPFQTFSFILMIYLSTWPPSQLLAPAWLLLRRNRMPVWLLLKLQLPPLMRSPLHVVRQPMPLPRSCRG